jgi:hypothetical protein
LKSSGFIAGSTPFFGFWYSPVFAHPQSTPEAGAAAALADPPVNLGPAMPATSVIVARRASDEKTMLAFVRRLSIRDD